METTKEIYKVGKVLKYGLYTGVKFLRKETIKGTKYAVLVDMQGNEKKVYLDLFEKHARVLG
jgi:hypothetical protein